MKISKLQKILGTTALAGLTAFIATNISGQGNMHNAYVPAWELSAFIAGVTGAAYGILKASVSPEEGQYQVTDLL